MTIGSEPSARVGLPSGVIVAGTRVLGGRYELGALIGTGGMADVFRATDRVLSRDVAIKMLRSGAGSDDERERFTAEARTLAAMNHPGLVTLLDAGITEEHPYLVMELVDGPTMAAEIRDSGPMDPLRVADLGAQVAEALAYAHGQGVVHRDVKPGNILIAADDRARLTDFGIARVLADGAHHTKTGNTVGSPAYLSPEQVSADPLTEAVDVYSLGLVLLEALTARRAYPGTPVEAAVARLSAAPAIPTSLNPGWRNLLTQMTQRDPAARPTTLEVAQTLSTSFTTPPVARAVTDLDAETGAFDLSDPAEPTRPLTEVGTDESDAAEPTVVGAPLAANPADGRRSVAKVAVAAVLTAAAVTAGFAALDKEPSSSRPPAYRAPAGVPDRMQQPLENLHTAVDEAQQ